ncbi:MAG TPA: tetratricopeptide repeat protein [Chthoniobacterales bacterium]
MAIAIGLVGLVWTAFGETMRNDFVNYDDGDYVYENSVVTKGLTVSGIKWAFTHIHAANWHPLTTISHMLDVQLYGLQPWGHHLTNVLLHAVATVLLFMVLRRLTLSIWTSAFVATLFAIHPLRVESVAWISERKDVLSGVFFMLTLMAYAAYAHSERRSIGRYLMVVVFFALGLMCKPTLVTLPFVLLLLDYWPLKRWPGGSKDQGMRQKVASAVSTSQRLNVLTFHWWSIVRGLVVEKIPLFALSAISCVITIIAQQQALEPNLDVGLPQRISNALTSYVIYLGQLIYPVHLTVSYPYVPVHISQVMFAILLLTVISTTFILLRRRYPFLITGWLWFLGTLVPMIGLVQVGLQPRADRYTYLSQIGLYILIACGAASVAGRSRRGRVVIAAAAVGAIAASIVLTRIQTTYWRNSEALWRHAIETTPTNYIAYNDLGTLLLHQNQPETAMAELQQAIQLKPDFENAYVSIGSALMLLDRIDDAIGYYLKALQIHPDSAEDWSNLATALLKKGNNSEAIVDYRKAAALKPASADMQYNLGHALANNGEWSDAITCYRAAIRIRPGDAKFHNNLAVALIRTGMSDKAVVELRRALEINPNYPEAHYNFGCVLVSLGRREEAASQFAETVRVQPDFSDARKQLERLSIPPSGPDR